MGLTEGFTFFMILLGGFLYIEGEKFKLKSFGQIFTFSIILGLLHSLFQMITTSNSFSQILVSLTLIKGVMTLVSIYTVNFFSKGR